MTIKKQAVFETKLLIDKLCNDRAKINFKIKDLRKQLRIYNKERMTKKQLSNLKKTSSSNEYSN